MRCALHECKRNFAALLAGLCGPFALLLAVGGYLAVRSTPWITPLFRLFPPGVWMGSLLGVFAFLLGIVGLLRRVEHPAASGILWAFSGLITGGMAIVMAAIIYAEAMSYGC